MLIAPQDTNAMRLKTKDIIFDNFKYFLPSTGCPNKNEAVAC